MKVAIVMTLSAYLMFCGCDLPSEKDLQRHDDAAAMCRRFLTSDQCSVDRRSEMHEAVGELLHGAAGRHCEGEVLKLIGAEILNADLEMRNSDYRDMARRVSSYEDCFECYEGYLFDSDLGSAYVMSTFFDCMQKLKDACFSISRSGRMKEENEKKFQERCYAVWGMMETYGRAMRLWELRMKRHLQILPESLRGEYMERRKSFLYYPKGRTLRESMLHEGSLPTEERDAALKNSHQGERMK